MSELLPCPFCGGEAETFAGIIIGGKNENVIVECTNCGAKVFRIQEVEAIEAWNNRIAETCENLKQHGYNYMECSACGETSYQGDKPFNYCPNCGRKVSA